MSDCSISRWSRSPAPMIWPSRNDTRLRVLLRIPGVASWRRCSSPCIAARAQASPCSTETAARVRFGCGSLQQLGEPARWRHDLAAVCRDRVTAAAHVQARWGDDVAAVAADVDAGAEAAAGVVGDVEAGVREVEVASPRSGPHG